MSRWNDCKITTEAQIINNSICKCDFLIRLFVIDSVFKLILPVSKYFQTINLDLNLAVQSVSNLKTSLQEMRDEATNRFSETVQTAV